MAFVNVAKNSQGMTVLFSKNRDSLVALCASKDALDQQHLIVITALVGPTGLTTENVCEI